MAGLDSEATMRTEPLDGAGVRRKRKFLILKFVSKYPEGVHEETICARLDMITGCTHYRLKVYIHELNRGGWLNRRENGVCKLPKPLEALYAEMVKWDSDIEAP